jgi:hypothetical protein
MAIVYVHKKKSDNSIFYVGIGVKEKRAYRFNNRNKLWHIIYEKFDVIVEITHRDICYEEACVIEKYLISFYGRKDKNNGELCNLTDGGDGICGFIKSNDLKEKHRKTMLGKQNMLGKKHSLESKNNISKSNKGKNRSISFKLKMKEISKNRFFSEETKKKISQKLKQKAFWINKFGENHNTSKRVSQYTLDGNFVAVFGSTREAKRFTKISHISSCCNKKRKTAGNYLWEYT